MRVMLWIVMAVVAGVCHTKEVDSFNLLLPTVYGESGGHAHQLITTSGGCYSWESTAPSIIHVTGHSPNNQNCFSNGVVKLMREGQYASSVYVTARDIKGPQVITIPVWIRALHSIAIFTKSRVMNVGDVQNLEVYGFDRENNTFTSLEGLRFKWQLHNGGSIDTITIQDSSLLLPLDIRKQLQAQHYQTDLLVVKALKVGKVDVSVRCIQPQYQHINHQVTIFIQERFDIVPSSPVYMLSGSSFQFYLTTIEGSNITLPEPHYIVEVGDGFSSTNTLLLSAPLYKSQSVLKVMDDRTNPPNQVEVEVFSYDPDEIRIIVSEQIVVGQWTPFTIEYYHDKVLLKGYSKKGKLTSDYLIDMERNKIQALKKMNNGVLSVNYNGMKASKQIDAVLPLKAILSQNYLHLPVGELFPLKIVGGSKQYAYSIQDHNIGSISSNGQLLTKSQGSTTITVTDKNNKRNNIIIDVKVQPVQSVSSVQEQKETNINEQTSIYILGKGRGGITYTSCNDIKLQVSGEAKQYFNYHVISSTANIVEEVQNSSNEMFRNFVRSMATIPDKEEFLGKFSKYVEEGDISQEELDRYVRELDMNGICAKIVLVSVKGYDGVVSVGTASGAKVDIPMRVYDALETGLVEKKQVVVTPLSSFQWRTNGGSYSWPTSTTKVYLNNIQQPNNNKNPRISCPNHQITLTYTLKYRNTQTKQLLRPTQQSIEIKMICQYPSSLQITQNRNIIPEKISLVPDQILEGTITALNSHHQPFYNSTSVICQCADQLKLVQQTSNTFKLVNKVEKVAKDNIINVRCDSVREGRQSSTFKSIQKSIFIHTLPPLKPLGQRDMIKLPLQLNRPHHIEINQIRELTIRCEDSAVVACELKKGYIQVQAKRAGKTKLIIIDNQAYNAPPQQIPLEIIRPTQLHLQTNKNQYMVGQDVVVRVQVLGESKEVIEYDINDVLMRGLNNILSEKHRSDKSITYKTVSSGLVSLMGALESADLLSGNKQILIHDQIRINQKVLEESVKGRFKNISSEVFVIMNCKQYIQIEGGPTTIRSELRIPISQLEIHKISERKYEFEGVKDGSGKVLIQVFYEQEKLAMIQFSVEVSPISEFSIGGSTQLLSGAQTRFISHYPQPEQLLTSSCNFIYRWSSSNSTAIKITSDPKLMGVNIAAEKGNAYLTMEIKNNRGRSISEVRKHIKVMDKVNISMPATLSGHSNQNGQILLPPNSAVQLAVDHIQLQPPCDERQQSLMTTGNKLISTSSLGTTQMKVSKSDRVPTYMSVCVKPVHSVYVENQHGWLKATTTQKKKYRVHLLDQYGQLFSGGPTADAYKVRVSNPGVALARMEDGFLVVEGYEAGQTMVSVSLNAARDMIPVVVRETTQTGGKVEKARRQQAQAAYKETNTATQSDDSWKWTDILVAVMAINFIIICILQWRQRQNNPVRVF